MPLPYEDASFDYLSASRARTYREPANAIREFSRLLAGGTLIVSVPNIMNTRNVSSGCSGQRRISNHCRLSGPGIRNDHPNTEEAAMHVNPIGYSEIRYLLEKTDLNWSVHTVTA
jgi:hypothetical protein